MSTQDGPPARLEVRGLRVSLTAGGPDVISDVTFAVRAGEILGLVGESGSGKTTLALALLGYARRGLQVAAGQVRLDGEDILPLDPHRLRAVRGAMVAYVPQDPSTALNPALRIGRQLREALRAHREPAAGKPASDTEQRIAEVLAETRLDPETGILSRYPHQLSGGQQQRVAIAMAFACRPAVIVLDEPTTGLDVSTQRHVLETVRRMCDAYGVAAVYVSHDLSVVARMATQVAVMYAGRVVELGPADQVFASPVHPYTRGLLAAVPSAGTAEVLTGIKGQPPRPGQRPAGCSFASRCEYAHDDCTAAPVEPATVNDRLVLCLRAGEIASKPRERKLRTVRPPSDARVPLLSLQGVSARYGRHRVLEDVSLTVPAQSCVAVVGESGSGKTTLARCIVGLHEDWAGQMSFGGQPLPHGFRQRPKDLMKRVQYIFQNPYASLNPRHRIGEIVAQPLERFYGLSGRECRDRVLRTLEDVSLGADFVQRYPDELSGGERQRVAIARAIAVDPELLVCDEVTSALDVSVQAVIVELLSRLQRERQLSMVFITHNLALVRSIAQSAIVLSGGGVVESGPVAQILDDPADPYTATLIQNIPRLVS